MKPETILNGMRYSLVQAVNYRMLMNLDHYSNVEDKMLKRERQYDAFRNRILKMFAEKDARIAELEAALESSLAYWERSK